MDIIEATKQEWRALGFHYDRDDSLKTWIFTGSQSGLLKLAMLFKQYGNNPRNAPLTEHEHYGPYGYLKVMTIYDEKGMNENAIYGTLHDIYALGELVEEALLQGDVGERISLGNQYAPEAQYDMVLCIQGEGFDPASIDAWILEKQHKSTSDSASR